MKKKLLAALLTLTMVLAVLPTAAWAGDGVPIPEPPAEGYYLVKQTYTTQDPDTGEQYFQKITDFDYEFDQSGDMKAQTQNWTQNGWVISQTEKYDEDGNVIAVDGTEEYEDSDSKKTVISKSTRAYDSSGNLTSEEYMETGTVVQNGETTITVRNNKTEYTFDEYGNMTADNYRSYKDEALQSEHSYTYVYTYNGNGQPLTKTINTNGTVSGIISYTYDSNGLLLTETTSKNDATYKTVSYTYDSQGRETEIACTYPNGSGGPSDLVSATEKYDYDTAGRVVKLVKTDTGKSGKIKVYTTITSYNNAGDILEDTYTEDTTGSDGTTSSTTTRKSYQYDSDGKLLRIDSNFNGYGQSVHEYDIYEYDEYGNNVKITRYLDGANYPEWIEINEYEKMVSDSTDPADETPDGPVVPAEPVDPDMPDTPDTPAASGFVDVKDGDWYADAVVWAVENDITTGTSATTFSPNASCTRAQAVTFLWRAAGEPEPEGTGANFTDVTDANSWYYKAVQWAVENGVTTGATETTFDPNGKCSRAQIVTFLYRLAQQPEVDGEHGFSDVSGEAYYADAVKWAVQNGITTGKTAATFAPDENCTRAQIVTFLYRDLA